jgi:hypothetical protein
MHYSFTIEVKIRAKAAGTLYYPWNLYVRLAHKNVNLIADYRTFSSAVSVGIGSLSNLGIIGFWKADGLSVTFYLNGGKDYSFTVHRRRN